MTQKDNLKLKYSHKKGFRLISVIIIINNIVKHSKALINKLYFPTRSEHNVRRHTLGHHHRLSRNIPHMNFHQVCPYMTILILDITYPQRISVLSTTLIFDILMSKSIGSWDYSYLRCNLSSINPRCLSNPPLSLRMPSIGLWLLFLSIMNDMENTVSIFTPSKPGSNNYHLKLVSKTLIKASTTCSSVDICCSSFDPNYITS